MPLADWVAQAVTEHLRAFPAERDGRLFTNAASGPINRGSYDDPGVASGGAHRGHGAVTRFTLRGSLAYL